MWSAAAALLGFFKANRRLVLLTLCLAVAAAFYVQWQAAEIQRQRAAADRASLIGAADAICAAMGAEFRPDGALRSNWGMACLGEARRLGRMEGDLAAGSLEVALEAMERQHGKEQADAALAAALSQRTAAAVERMEAADAAVEGDRVGPGWAAAVNELGGLRR